MGGSCLRETRSDHAVGSVDGNKPGAGTRAWTTMTRLAIFAAQTSYK
jgi:hypothetical protein